MGIVKDIFDSVKNVFQTASDIDDKVNNLNKKSFAKGASEQTFQMPCIVANSIPIDFASTLVRNLDSLYATFIQIYLSANGVIDLNYIKNPRQFVQQYKTNFSLESVSEEEIYDAYEEELVSDLNHYYESFYHGEPRLYPMKKDNFLCLVTESQRPTANIMKKVREGMKEPLSIYNIKEERKVYTEADKNEILDQLLINREEQKEQEENLNSIRATKDAQAPKITERDIKKLNDMKPYVIDLKILATKGDSSFSQFMTFSVGVKTTCHLAKSDILIKNIVYVLRNRNAMFNFIRWTTGEISLLKDIILKLDDTNFNIHNKNDATGKMISKLKELKKKKVKVTTAGLSRIAPFATMVISNYEYNEILTKYGFDLKNITYAKKVMDELFLMCFVVIDETTQTVDILLDGSTNGFQTYSLDMLQRETTMNSSKLGQELTRMLGSN